EEQLEKAVKSAEATGDPAAIAEAKAVRDAAKADIDKAKADADAAVAAADTALAKATDLGKGVSDTVVKQTDDALQNADKLINDAKSSGDKAAAEAALKAAQDALAKAKAELELMKSLYGENSPQAQAAQDKVNRAEAQVAAAQALLVEQPKVGERFVVADQTYEVLTVPASGNCSATLVKANNAKTVVVPETVAYKGRTFEVNEINTKAFYKNTKKVTLGANVDTIDKQAFKGSKVKTVILKTKDLTKKGVKGSLKGSKVTTVKVKVGAKKANQKFVKKYKKIFTKKIAGKKVTVK
ncbi:MAG: hypothetical protein IKE52_02240, partial [Mogibacterium sp.]|nr:hypothetical protein [Mogibacterium sp.]